MGRFAGERELGLGRGGLLDDLGGGLRGGVFRARDVDGGGGLRGRSLDHDRWNLLGRRGRRNPHRRLVHQVREGGVHQRVEGRRLGHLLGMRGEHGEVRLAEELVEERRHDRLERGDLRLDPRDVALHERGMARKLALELVAAACGPGLRLFADPGDLRLRPFLDAREVGLGAPAQGVGLGDRAGLDLLHVGGSLDTELLEGCGASLFGCSLHRVGHVDEELRRAPGRARGGARDIDGGEGCGGRGLVRACHGLAGFAAGRRRLRVALVGLPEVGAIGVIAGRCPIRAPREPEARS